jgi:uracil-DNA glycosylase
MKRLLDELVDELRDLKREGVSYVSVSEEALGALRNATLPLTKDYSNDLSVKETDKPEEKKQEEKKIEIPALLNPDFPLPPEVKLPVGNKQEQYAWLRDRILGCPVCNEHIKPGKKVVVGSGNLNADIFFCGEAPGEDEEILGEVFVGKAGQLLTKIIEAMGVKRNDVYIANIMNWRPETDFGNRPPLPEELEFCLPYLKAQLSIVQPKVIVALGKTAVQGLLKPVADFTMGEMRGKWHDYCGLPMMITFHPSYLLRNQQLRSKRMVWEDMLMVMEKVNMPITDKQRNFFQS